METPVKEFIHRFNQSWTEGKLNEMDSLLHDEVVFVAADLITAIRGKEDCLQTLKEYNAQAQTQVFRIEGQRIHRWGPTASVALEYYIEYLMNESLHEERGKEFWTLHRENGSWQMVWRVMVSNDRS